MKTKLFAIFALIACLSFAGCSKKDDEIIAVMKDLNSFTTEMVAKVQAASDPAIGLSEAQKFFDTRQADLKKRFDVIREVRSFQVSEETQKKMQDDITNNVTNVASLQITYASRSVRDSRFKASLEKLVGDYQKLIGG
jgi:hypothetical protein